MNRDLPAAVRKAIILLKNNHFEVYLVGGSVRALLLGLQPSDYDLATSAHPDELCSVFQEYKVILTGVEHGTVTVVMDQQSIEITTYRIDGTYSDKRRPDQIIFANRIIDDLARRDFTINAMAWTPPSGNLYADFSPDGVLDPFNGRSDLERRLIRSVGQPDLRFQEDALRVLRSLRFASELSFTIEEKTGEAVHIHKDELSTLPAERIFSELKRLLTGQHVEYVLKQYGDVLCVVIPELCTTESEPKSRSAVRQKLDQNTIQFVSNSPAVLNLRLAALLDSLVIDDESSTESERQPAGHNLNDRNARIAERILDRLRCDRATQTRVESIIRNQTVLPAPTGPSVKHWLRRLGVDLASDILIFARVKASVRGTLAESTALDQIEQILNLVLTDQQCYTISHLAVGGQDLLELGMSRGPEIGAMLDTLLTRVIDGHLTNEKPALMRAAENLLHHLPDNN